MQRLKLVLRALKSIAPHTATRLPITNDILLKIRPHMKLDTYEGKVMWCNEVISLFLIYNLSF